MIFSLGIMVLCGLLLSGIMQKLKLPGLIGMLITGIILGPFALNLIAPEILNVSADLRELALIVILTRAGLSLNISDLKKVGRSAVLMCFVPATFEIAAVTLFAPMLFPITRLDAAIMGTVLGAVSPAVIVPKMLMLMETRLYYSQKPSCPCVTIISKVFKAMVGCRTHTVRPCRCCG
jgi:NhaP-type Na+/H+ or K+/H+ antiporter